MIINKDSLIEGLIIPIFKPLNWTSFDVVKKLRGDFKKTFNLKKLKLVMLVHLTLLQQVYYLFVLEEKLKLLKIYKILTKHILQHSVLVKQLLLLIEKQVVIKITQLIISPKS